MAVTRRPAPNPDIGPRNIDPPRASRQAKIRTRAADCSRCERKQLKNWGYTPEGDILCPACYFGEIDQKAAAERATDRPATPPDELSPTIHNEPPVNSAPKT